MKITDEQLESAMDAYRATAAYPVVPGNHKIALRAALEAALTGAGPQQAVEPVHSRWSFDDMHIGTMRPDGRALDARLIRRPNWLTGAAWYEFARSVCDAHNTPVAIEDSK